MNYYAKGGQPHGLRALAQELPKYGRMGDTIVAHINPQEAALLKVLGGSGTINPTTGLPEFGIFGIGGGGGFLGTGINKNASDPISNALSNNPISRGVSKGVQGLGGAIDKGLVGLDKAIGNAIPGGWGTVASIAASAMGVPMPFRLGLGALTGSGVLRPGRGFNLQGAIMGGIVAYGMGELGEGLRGAAEVGSASSAASAAPNVVPTPDVFTPSSTGLMTLPSEAAGFAGSPTSGLADVYKPGLLERVGSGISDTASRIGTGISDAASAVVDPNTYKGVGSAAMENLGKTGTGIQNLMGLGDVTAKEAAQGFTGAGATMTNTALPIGMGLTGQAAMDEARKQQDQANTANAAAQQQYNDQMAIIAANQRRGEEAVRRNPYMFNEGGMPPRFLSGGGDGMSDSIPAKINDRQEARLADGEFVIPADVVSHLGNGSSKAGAKQLYSMMDRVRQKRTGTKQQGKEIMPRKLMPA